MTITISEELLAEAQKLSGKTGYSDAIAQGLRRASKASFSAGRSVRAQDSVLGCAHQEDAANAPMVTRNEAAITFGTSFWTTDGDFEDLASEGLNLYA